MPDSSIAVRARKASALRRWHEHVKTDLGRIVEKMYSQKPVSDADRDTYHDNERSMQRIVGAFVHVRLEGILSETRLDYPDIADTKLLMGKVAFRKTTFVSDSQIHTLSLLMKQTKQESHYSEAVISEYIVRSFNRSGKRYGVMATMDFGDIVIVADQRRSRREILESFRKA